jgi:gas vesicle protein
MRKGAATATATTSTIKKQFAILTGSADSIGTSFVKAFSGVATVGAVIGFGRTVLAAGDQIQKMSDQTGLSIEQVQRLQHVAGQSGTSIESMVGAVQNLQQRLGDDSTGAAGAMKKLGINMAEFSRLDAFGQMTTLATAIRNIQDPTEQASTAAAVFGKSWKEILPAIKADMVAVGNQATVMADDTVKSLDRIGDALTGAKQQWTAWGGTAVVAIEQIGFALGGGLGTNVMLRKFIEENDPTGLGRAMDRIKPAAIQGAAGLRNLQMSADDLANVEAKLTKQVRESIDANQEAITLEKEQLEARIKLREEMERQLAFGRSWAMFQAMNIEKAGGLSDILGRGKTEMMALPFDVTPTLDEQRLRQQLRFAIPNIQSNFIEPATHEIREGFDAAFAAIGPSLQRALEGGGDVLKSIGGAFGGALTQSIFGGKEMQANITKIFGQTLGGAFNALLPGLGTIVGPLLGKLGGFFKRIFGFGDDEKKPPAPPIDTRRHIPKGSLPLSFATGGFVPPGAVVPAMLHGGLHGEDVVPRGTAGGGSSITINISASAIDAAGMDQVFKQSIIPRIKSALVFNENGLLSVAQRTVR